MTRSSSSKVGPVGHCRFLVGSGEGKGNPDAKTSTDEDDTAAPAAEAGDNEKDGNKDGGDG
jgi:hypothetical protein